MSVRPVLVALSVVFAAAVVALLVAQLEWPGSLADCVQAGTCDCETVGRDGIRQPVNSLSSLGLVVAGAALLTRSAKSRLRLFAVALIGAGIASFVSHAAVRDWSHTLDSLGVKALLLVLLIYPLTRPRPILAPYAAALLLVWATELTWAASGGALFAVLVIGAVIANLPRGVPGSALRWAGIIFLLAVAAWWFGRSDSALCEPDSLFQPHALWHLLVAGGLAAVHQHYREIEAQ